MGQNCFKVLNVRYVLKHISMLTPMGKIKSMFEFKTFFCLNSMKLVIRYDKIMKYN